MTLSRLAPIAVLILSALDSNALPLEKGLPREVAPELKRQYVFDTAEDSATIAAATESKKQFLDELFGLTVLDGYPSNETDVQKHLELNRIFEKHADQNRERMLTHEDLISKKKMKQFTMFSDAEGVPTSTIDDGQETFSPGDVTIITGSLYNTQSYSAGTSDMVCTYMFQDASGQDKLCSAVMVFFNKYGFEVGQVHLQGLMLGSSTYSDIFSVVGGTGCFSGATGIATVERLPVNSIWYSYKHDFYLYEYWQHEYNNENNSPF